MSPMRSNLSTSYAPGEVLRELLSAYTRYKTAVKEMRHATNTNSAASASSVQMTTRLVAQEALRAQLEHTCNAICLGGEEFVRLLDTSALVRLLCKVLDRCEDSEVQTLAMRAFGRIADTVPDGCHTLARRSLGAIATLTRFLGNDALMLHQPAMLEELLTCLRYLAHVAHPALSSAHVFDMVVALEPKLTAHHLKVRCLQVMSNLLATARSTELRQYAPALHQVLHNMRHTMAFAFADSGARNGTSSSSNAAGADTGQPQSLPQNDYTLLRLYCSCIAHACDRLCGVPSALRVETRLIDAIVSTLVLLMTYSMRCMVKVVTALCIAACSALLTLYLTDPPFIITFLVRHKVFETVCNVALQLLRAPGDTADDAGAEHDVVQQQQHNNTSSQTSSLSSPHHSDNTMTRDRNNNTTESEAHAAHNDTDASLATNIPNADATTTTVNFAQLPITDDVNSIPFMGQEIALIPLLEFLLVVLPPASATHSRLDAQRVTLPFYNWKWEDDFHNENMCGESMSWYMETMYNQTRESSEASLVTLTHRGRPPLYVDFVNQFFKNDLYSRPSILARVPLLTGYLHTQRTGLLEPGCCCQYDTMQHATSNSRKSGNGVLSRIRSGQRLFTHRTHHVTVPLAPSTSTLSQTALVILPRPSNHSSSRSTSSSSSSSSSSATAASLPYSASTSSMARSGSDEGRSSGEDEGDERNAAQSQQHHQRESVARSDPLHHHTPHDDDVNEYYRWPAPQYSNHETNNSGAVGTLSHRPTSAAHIASMSELEEHEYITDVTPATTSSHHYHHIDDEEMLRDSGMNAAPPHHTRHPTNSTSTSSSSTASTITMPAALPRTHGAHATRHAAHPHRSTHHTNSNSNDAQVADASRDPNALPQQNRVVDESFCGCCGGSSTTTMGGTSRQLQRMSAVATNASYDTLNSQGRQQQQQRGTRGYRHPSSLAAANAENNNTTTTAGANRISEMHVEVHHMSMKKLQRILVDCRVKALTRPATRHGLLNEKVLKPILSCTVPLLVTLIKSCVNRLVARHATVLLLRLLSLSASFCQLEAQEETQAKRSKATMTSLIPRVMSLHTGSGQRNSPAMSKLGAIMDDAYDVANNNNNNTTATTLINNTMHANNNKTMDKTYKTSQGSLLLLQPAQQRNSSLLHHNNNSSSSKVKMSTAMRHIAEIIAQLTPSLVETLPYLYLNDTTEQINGALVAPWLPFRDYIDGATAISALAQLGLEGYFMSYTITQPVEMRLAAAESLRLVLRFARLAAHMSLATGNKPVKTRSSIGVSGLRGFMTASRRVVKLPNPEGIEEKNSATNNNNANSVNQSTSPGWPLRQSLGNAVTSGTQNVTPAALPEGPLSAAQVEAIVRMTQIYVQHARLDLRCARHVEQEYAERKAEDDGDNEHEWNGDEAHRNRGSAEGETRKSHRLRLRPVPGCAFHHTASALLELYINALLDFVHVVQPPMEDVALFAADSLLLYSGADVSSEDAHDNSGDKKTRMKNSGIDSVIKPQGPNIDSHSVTLAALGSNYAHSATVPPITQPSQPLSTATDTVPPQQPQQVTNERPGGNAVISLERTSTADPSYSEHVSSSHNPLSGAPNTTARDDTARAELPLNAHNKQVPDNSSSGACVSSDVLRSTLQTYVHAQREANDAFAAAPESVQLALALYDFVQTSHVGLGAVLQQAPELVQEIARALRLYTSSCQADMSLAAASPVAQGAPATSVTALPRVINDVQNDKAKTNNSTQGTQQQQHDSKAAISETTVHASPTSSAPVRTGALTSIAQSKLLNLLSQLNLVIEQKLGLSTLGMSDDPTEQLSASFSRRLRKSAVQLTMVEEVSWMPFFLRVMPYKHDGKPHPLLCVFDENRDKHRESSKAKAQSNATASQSPQGNDADGHKAEHDEDEEDKGMLLMVAGYTVRCRPLSHAIRNQKLRAFAIPNVTVGHLMNWICDSITTKPTTKTTQTHENDNSMSTHDQASWSASNTLSERSRQPFHLPSRLGAGVTTTTNTNTAPQRHPQPPNALPGQRTVSQMARQHVMTQYGASGRLRSVSVPSLPTPTTLQGQQSAQQQGQPSHQARTLARSLPTLPTPVRREVPPILPSQILVIVGHTPILCPLMTIFEALCYYGVSGQSVRTMLQDQAGMSGAEGYMSTSALFNGGTVTPPPRVARGLTKTQVEQFRTLPFWRLVHKIFFVVLDRPLPHRLRFPATCCGCAWTRTLTSVMSPSILALQRDTTIRPLTTGIEYRCTPAHFFSDSNNSRTATGNVADSTDAALQLLLELTQVLREAGRVPAALLYRDQRRLNTSLVHELYSQLAAFIMPPLLYGSMFSTWQHPETQLASRALWGYPFIFSFEMRLTLLELFLSFRRTLTERAELQILHFHHVFPDVTFLGLQWADPTHIEAMTHAELRNNEEEMAHILHDKHVLLVPDRNNLLDAAEKLGRLASCPFEITVCFKDESGIGIGPAFELYELLGRELTSPACGAWRVQEEAMPNVGVTTGTSPVLVTEPLLFPAARQTATSLHYIELLGVLMGRLLRLRRTSLLRFHPLFLRRLLGQRLAATPAEASTNMAQLDETFERSLRSLERMSAEELAACALTMTVTIRGVTTHAGYPRSLHELELQPNGAHTAVTTDNVHLYTHLVRGFYLEVAVDRALQHFRLGLQSTLNPVYLGLFSESELDRLFSGSVGKLWHSSADFAKDVIACHGYTLDSAPVRLLLEVVPRWPAVLQRAFLRFVTGSSAMPLRGLQPPITVVQRSLSHMVLQAPSSESSPTREGNMDSFASAQQQQQQQQQQEMTMTSSTMAATTTMQPSALPTVSTCFHYLKLPPYDSAETLERQLRLAVTEGQESFLLT